MRMRVTEEDKIVSRNIKRLRQELNLDRRELEEKAEIAFGILDQIENFHKSAGKSIRKRLITYFKCSYAELYYESGVPGVSESQEKYETVMRSPVVKEYIDKTIEILNSENKQAVHAIKTNINVLHQLCRQK